MHVSNICFISYIIKTHERNNGALGLSEVTGLLLRLNARDSSYYEDR